jgi:hypothetical protein
MQRACGGFDSSRTGLGKLHKCLQLNVAVLYRTRMGASMCHVRSRLCRTLAAISCEVNGKNCDRRVSAHYPNEFGVIGDLAHCLLSSNTFRARNVEQRLEYEQF